MLLFNKILYGFYFLIHSLSVGCQSLDTCLYLFSGHLGLLVYAKPWTFFYWGISLDLLLVETTFEEIDGLLDLVGCLVFVAVVKLLPELSDFFPQLKSALLDTADSTNVSF